MTLWSPLIQTVQASSSNVGPSGVVEVFIPSIEHMVSSWYGDESGPKMANGHLYNKMAMTVAHRTLPFGTKLLLINPVNHKEAIVTVTDRGPYIHGRNLDCSEGVAIKLGFQRKGLENLIAIRLNYLPGKPGLTDNFELRQAKVHKPRTFRRVLDPASLCFSTGTFAPLHYIKNSPFVFNRTAFAQKPIYVCEANVVENRKGLLGFDIAKGPRGISYIKPLLRYKPMEKLTYPM
jgi:rare lipoprotein A